MKYVEGLYNSVEEKLQAEYNFEMETLRSLMRDSQSGVTVSDVDKRLERLALLKMKIDILKSGAVEVKKDTKNLLFG